MTVQVDDVNNVAQVQQDISTLLRARHHLAGPVSSSQGQRNGGRNPARGLGLGGGFGRPVEVDRKGQYRSNKKNRSRNGSINTSIILRFERKCFSFLRLLSSVFEYFC